MWRTSVLDPAKLLARQQESADIRARDRREAQRKAHLVANRRNLFHQTFVAPFEAAVPTRLTGLFESTWSEYQSTGDNNLARALGVALFGDAQAGISVWEPSRKARYEVYARIVRHRRSTSELEFSCLSALWTEVESRFALTDTLYTNLRRVLFYVDGRTADENEVRAMENMEEYRAYDDGDFAMGEGLVEMPESPYVAPSVTGSVTHALGAVGLGSATGSQFGAASAAPSWAEESVGASAIGSVGGAVGIESVLPFQPPPTEPETGPAPDVAAVPTVGASAEPGPEEKVSIFERLSRRIEPKTTTRLCEWCGKGESGHDCAFETWFKENNGVCEGKVYVRNGYPLEIDPKDKSIEAAWIWAEIASLLRRDATVSRGTDGFWSCHPSRDIERVARIEAEVEWIRPTANEARCEQVLRLMGRDVIPLVRNRYLVRPPMPSQLVLEQTATRRGGWNGPQAAGKLGRGAMRPRGSLGRQGQAGTRGRPYEV